MKKMVSLILAALLVLSIPLAALANAPVTLTTKGAAAKFGANALPYIADNGSTMVPLGYLDALGIWTAWNEQTWTATLINGRTVVATTTRTTVNGAPSPFPLDLTLSGNVPYVKLRAVSLLFGFDLAWNEATRTVNVVDTLAKPVATNKDLILATTTSTQDSGLLDFLLPEFQKDTGINVKTISVGSGAAIKMGEDGEADVMLVHSPAAEIEAMKASHAISRRGLMYNDFIIVGPEADPANVKAAGGDAVAALKAIYESGSAFVSRGDNSGTHTLEKSLWASAGITPDSKNYLEASTGMLATLNIAEQRNGYTVTDRATYLKNLDKMELVILCEGDKLLLNPYSVMIVNPSKNDLINVLAAFQFSNWLVSEKGQKLIDEYGVAEFGDPLFFASYKAEY